MSTPDIDALLSDMAKESIPPESAGDGARRRQRVIGGLQALQRRALDDATLARRRRRLLIWGAAAASLAFCGTALAGSILRVLRVEPAPAPDEASIIVPNTALESVRSREAQPDREEASGSAAAFSPVPSAPSGWVENPVQSATPKTRARDTHASSDLEEANRLFSEAKRARREHRDNEVLSLLGQLMAKHPRSVLVHEALVERFRALARVGRVEEARRDAAGYLARYPMGFAADEARRLLDEGTR